MTTVKSVSTDDWLRARRKLLENGLDVAQRYRDASLVAVSSAPVENLENFKKKIGWNFLWVSSLNNTFSADSRGLDAFSSACQLLDLPPKGRDEDSLAFTMEWVRRSYEYD